MLSQYLNEALKSAESFKRHNNIDITLFTDQPNEIPDGIFNNIKPCPFPHDDSLIFLNKISSCLNSPYEETLFIDGDTLCVDNIMGVFDNLKKYDYATSLTPEGGGLSIATMTKRFGVPVDFPLYNTGVMLWRKNDRTTLLLKDWLDKYKNRTFFKNNNDQFQFRLSLWNSGVRLLTLRKTWNARFLQEGKQWNEKDFYYFVKKMNKLHPFRIIHDRVLIKNLDKWYEK